MSIVMLCIVIVYILPGEIYPITKSRQEKYFFIAFSLKDVKMSKCIDGRGFLWIQNENLNFSTTKMTAALISTRNA